MKLFIIMPLFRKKQLKMNANGCFVVIPREIIEHADEYYIKLWYHLFSQPKTLEQFYQVNSFANIYINEIKKEMTYNLPNKTGILDHIEINLV